MPSHLASTIDLARRVERAEIEFCALAGCTGLGRPLDRFDAGGGVALFGKPGSPFNKVLGLGLAGAVRDDDLDGIVRFYEERGSPAQVELCPMAYADVAARLGARGFLVQGFESELGRLQGATPAPPSDVRVALVEPHQEDLWLRTVAEGFGAAESLVGGGPAHETFTTEQAMEMMADFRHPRLRRVLAWIDGQAAGGGSSWMLDGVLGIAGTSTLPRFRRRGVQTAITAQAILDGPGADLIIATTAPGSTSQRTFERLGFQLLYTRAILVKA
jgi:hypothetical protein